MSSRHRIRGFLRDAFAPEDADVFDRVSLAMLLALALTGPFLYRAVLPATFAAGAPAPIGNFLLNLLAFLTASTAFFSRSAPVAKRPLAIPLGAAGGLALLGALQLVPLPEGVMRRIASVNLKIYHETAEILGLFGRPGGPVPRISVAPGETLDALLGLLAFIAIGLSAVILLRNRARRRLLGWTVATAAALQVLRGVPAFPGLPVDPSPVSPDRTAAACAGIALCVVFGKLWAGVLTSPDRGLDSADSAERLERRLAPVAFLAILWLALAAGLLLTRATTIFVAALGVNLILTWLALARRRRDFAPGRPGVAAALALIVLPVGVASETSAPVRASIRSACLDAWRQFPIVGSGLGTFPDAFRRVQPREIPGLVDEARSVPLELLVTGGAAGFVLGAAMVISLLVILYRAWRSQKHREESALVLSAFGALLFWALAGFFESTPSSRPVSLLLAPVLGMGWAAAQARGGRGL